MQSQVGGQVQTRAMKTMARMLRQRLSNPSWQSQGQRHPGQPHDHRPGFADHHWHAGDPSVYGSGFF